MKKLVSLTADGLTIGMMKGNGEDNISFLGLWDKLHNPDFKLVEFDQFKNEAAITDTNVTCQIMEAA